MVKERVVKQLNHITNTTQNHHMQEIKRVEDNNEQEAVKEYVDGLENNIQWWQEQCAIYQTQKELAQAKVRKLEYQYHSILNLVL